MFVICFSERGVNVWIAGPVAAYATAPAAITATRPMRRRAAACAAAT